MDPERRIADKLSSGAAHELLWLAGKRTGPHALDFTELERLGLVEFVKETRRGTTWWRVTLLGHRVAELLRTGPSRAERTDAAGECSLVPGCDCMGLRSHGRGPTS